LFVRAFSQNEPIGLQCDGTAQLRLLEEEDMSRYAERGTVVTGQRLFPASRASGAATTSARVDAGEVDVAVDETEDDAKAGEYEDGDDTTRHPLLHDGRRQRRRLSGRPR